MFSLKKAIMFKLFIKMVITRACQNILLRQAKDVTTSLPQGCLMVIAPHPDDETLSCAGLMSHYKSRDLPIKIVVVTDGSAARLPNSPSPQEVAIMRRKESIQAANLLGIPAENLMFLAYPDGHANDHIEQITQDIESQIWLYQPALIVSPHGIDAHTDHRTVAQVVHTLKQKEHIKCPVWEYPMWFWPKGAIRHLLSKTLRATHIKVNVHNHLQIKQDAINAHECQKSEENWNQLEAYTIASNLRDEELFFVLDR